MSGDEYGTPNGLFLTISKEFGPFDMDGAAQAHNTKLKKWTNNASLDTWSGHVWLNPPFSKMKYFTKLSHLHTLAGGKVTMLCRHDVSTRWWQEYIHRQAAVRMLRCRVEFIGATQAYNFPVSIVLFRHLLPEVGYEYFESWPRQLTKQEISRAVFN